MIGCMGRCFADRALLSLLIACGIVLFVTMPAEIIPSDTFASRSEAAHLITNHVLGFDYSCRQQPIGDFLQPHKGEYFYENDGKRMFFSKYGIMDTLMYVPPLFAEYLWAGKVDDLDSARSTVFFLNLYNIILALICIYYFYKLVEFYGDDRFVKCIFVLASVFCTYLWFFLRMQMHEIFQLLFFLGFFYHVGLFLKASRQQYPSGTWFHLLVAVLFLGGLVLTKIFFAVIMASVLLIVLWSGPENLLLRERIQYHLGCHKKDIAGCLIVPLLLVVVVQLWLNFYKTGSLWDAGYSQEAISVAGAHFSLKTLGESIPGYFLRPGNTNVFLHYPPLLLALFGVVAFGKRWRDDLLLILVVVSPCLVALTLYEGWRGEWSYGPRYLLPFAVVGSLPALATIGYLRRQMGSWWGRVAVAITVVVLAWSLLLQVSVNSVNPWAFYYHQEVMMAVGDHEIDDYFNSYLHRGQIYLDILAYRLGWPGKSYFPVAVVQEKYPEIYAASSFHTSLLIRCQPNYFFLNFLFPESVAQAVSP